MFGKSKKGHISDLVSYAGYYFGADIEAEGDIKTDEDVYIDGKFKGTIDTPGAVELGKNSVVNGSVSARSIVIEGSAKLDSRASESIIIAGCAEFRGNARARQINVEAGADIDAKLVTGKENV